MARSLTLPEDDKVSDQLLEATIPMTSDAACAGAWGSAFHEESMVCAGGGSRDTCGGDSGGPLMVGDGAFLILAGAAHAQAARARRAAGAALEDVDRAPLTRRP